ncbi:trypsin beta-like [Episyrphus balteatus]|uniref:trypsin beta-like n=1 Tax=Episyrphus balteatus TaxID=286459 RepID=UPI002485B1E1|nr:trypsin beta-like [Episyrphus balteatus]
MFRLIVVVLSVLCFASAAPENNSDRIVNGRSASILEYNYQVSIQQDGFHFCGGSIIGRKWILTAAHCLRDIIAKNQQSSLRVYLGSSSWASGGVAKAVKWVKNHPDYNAKTMDFDVGIMELDSDIMYSSRMKPVNICSNTIAINRPVDASGWGKLNETSESLPTLLNAVTMKFVPTADCASGAYNYKAGEITDSMICAIGPGQDSCQGDSGGPLVTEGTNNQIGVVSWGNGCAKPGLPGVYCKLAHPKVITFIKSSCPEVNFTTC